MLGKYDTYYIVMNYYQRSITEQNHISIPATDTKEMLSFGAYPSKDAEPAGQVNKILNQLWHN